MDKRKEYEANYQFKGSWVVVYPWVMNVLGLDGPTILHSEMQTYSHIEARISSCKQRLIIFGSMMVVGQVWLMAMG